MLLSKASLESHEPLLLRTIKHWLWFNNSLSDVNHEVNENEKYQQQKEIHVQSWHDYLLEVKILLYSNVL